MEPPFQTPQVTLWHGDCRDVLAGLPDASIDSVVTDPPYELGFMGKGWDGTGIAFDVALWRDVLRVLKPGGHLLTFGGTRGFRCVAIEEVEEYLPLIQARIHRRRDPVAAAKLAGDLEDSLFDLLDEEGA